jgi:predicted O-linked N-acetylglucosamine transferase (SPINDLY family)
MDAFEKLSTSFLKKKGPVVTFQGDRWVSRTSATILRTAGFADLVAESPHDYIRLASHLGENVEKLKTMRSNMRDKLLQSDACDTLNFAKSMERLYRDLWET